MTNVFENIEQTKPKDDELVFANITNFLNDSNFSEQQKDMMNDVIISWVQREDSTDFLKQLDNNVKEWFFSSIKL